MKKLAIIGSGDLGQLAAHHAKVCGYEVVGYFDDTKSKGTLIKGCPVLGKTFEIENSFADKTFDFLFSAIGYKHFKFRKEIFEKYFGKIPFAKLIHPSCYIDPSCNTGEGIFLLPGCVLDKDVKLGNNILLNTGVIIAHDTQIGSHSFIAPAVHLAGFIKTGECCMLGIGTTVIDNITLGNNIQTGAGAVVTEDISEPGLYVGVPARKIKQK